MANGQGGFRPGAPQNNPTRINPMGGDGQSGRNITQPSRYIPGLPYGQGQATMEQQQGAPMAGMPEPRPQQVENIPMPSGIGELQGDMNTPITEGINNLPPGLSGGFYRTPTISGILQEVSKYDPTGDVELIYARYSDYGY